MGNHTRCCSYDPPPCGFCTADSDTNVVAISGIIVDACSECIAVDGTYVLGRSYINACRWNHGRFFSFCDGTPFTFRLNMQLQLDAMVLSPGSNQGWQLTITLGIGFDANPYFSGQNTAIYRWNSGSSADFDCTATRTLTLYTYTPNPDPAKNPCDSSALTITVNP